MVNHRKEMFCKLCLNNINYNNYQEIKDDTREILDVLLIKVYLEEESKYLMCGACSEKLYAAFDFKTKCFYSDDVIFPYVDSDQKSPIDLEQVILNETAKCGRPVTVQENEKICRLCFEFTDTCKSFTEIEEDVISTYIPEINVTCCKDPFICESCVNSLKIHSQFIKTCLDSQEKMNQSTECQTESMSNSLNMNAKKIDGKIAEDENQSQNRDQQHVFENKGSEVQWHKCDVCDYKAKCKEVMDKHKLKHKDLSETKIYECDACDFKSKRKIRLTNHMYQHMDPLEIKWYNCDVCYYKTKDKYALQHHERRHYPYSKCSKCDYKFTWVHQLESHMLQHMDSSGIEWFECDECKYKCTKKSSAIRHKRKHHDRTWECPECDYKAFKLTFWQTHVMQHPDSLVIPWLRCRECDYKCIRALAMKKHKSEHVRQRPNQALTKRIRKKSSKYSTKLSVAQNVST